MTHDEMYEDDEMYLKHTFSLFTSNKNVALLAFAMERYLRENYRRQVEAANIIVRQKDSEFRVEMFTNEPDFECPPILQDDTVFMNWCMTKVGSDIKKEDDDVNRRKY